ncbi:MAG: TMEM165/GDT1 family protein [Polynucleobacter sp.]|nr:TMEM165/GDT1 family protein [Polynucleobacter sp.]
MDFAALFISTSVVALAEIGDKTQLLSLMLAARYPKQAWPIISGIFIATLFNHAGAALVGHCAADFLSPELMRWILGVGFLLIGFWLLIPDRFDESKEQRGANRAWQVFVFTATIFFLAEMGDKTQIATIALGARYDSVTSVILGTTVGMMIANIPAVWLGRKFTERLPIKLVHAIAAVVFIGLGIATIIFA